MKEGREDVEGSCIDQLEVIICHNDVSYQLRTDLEQKKIKKDQKTLLLGIYHEEKVSQMS